MQPIRTRSDLTALVARHAPTNACARAIEQNRATVLGGFTPANGLPSYVVQITSKHDRIWYFMVECDEEALRYNVRIIEEPPWESWIGKSTGKRPLIDGDCPIHCAFERMTARKK